MADVVGSPPRSFVDRVRAKGASSVMGYTAEEVFGKVTDIVCEALGVDEDEVKPESTLAGDLGMESIDMLDIVFQLEKAFSIKIDKGELSWEELLNNAEYMDGDRITPAGLEQIRKTMPHLDVDALEKDPYASKMPDIFTVQTIVDFVLGKQAAAQPG